MNCAPEVDFLQTVNSCSLSISMFRRLMAVRCDLIIMATPPYIDVECSAVTNCAR